MPRVDAIGSRAKISKALRPKRHRDKRALTAFNAGVVVFFTLVFFLSLLGFAL